MNCNLCDKPIDPSNHYHVRHEGAPDEVFYCWDCGCEMCQEEQKEEHE